MKTYLFNRLLMVAAILLAGVPLHGAEMDAALQAKVDARVKEIQTWASDPVVVKAVVDHNASLPADQAAMTQDKWKTLTVLDPFVRSFSTNAAGQYLKSKKGADIAEAFLNGADGLKVAFLGKTSGWSHKGKPKHDVPMSGKTWQGSIEVDESTGLQQVQVAVPVLDGGKPVGSLVVGLAVSKL